MGGLSCCPVPSGGYGHGIGPSTGGGIGGGVGSAIRAPIGDAVGAIGGTIGNPGGPSRNCFHCSIIKRVYSFLSSNATTCALKSLSLREGSVT